MAVVGSGWWRWWDRGGWLVGSLPPQAAAHSTRIIGGRGSRGEVVGSGRLAGRIAPGLRTPRIELEKGEAEEIGEIEEDLGEDDHGHHGSNESQWLPAHQRVHGAAQRRRRQRLRRADGAVGHTCSVRPKAIHGTSMAR